MPHKLTLTQTQSYSLQKCEYKNKTIFVTDEIETIKFNALQWNGKQ